jgi:hypothetical protein
MWQTTCRANIRRVLSRSWLWPGLNRQYRRCRCGVGAALANFDGEVIRIGRINWEVRFRILLAQPFPTSLINITAMINHFEPAGVLIE